MKVPKNIIIKTVDEIRGVTNYDSNVIDDQVIIKSDGYPTYHLAVVVDDHLMEISHMVRGEDWLPSAPKQFLLYKMFGWKPPLFYHTVNLRNPDKKKMSKRHGHSNVDWYKEEGFLPEAVLNYLALLGWSHPDKIEFFSLNDFISVFDLRDIRATPPIFDLVKLTWMNGEYIRKMKPGELARKIYAFFNGKYSKELIIKTIPLIQERIKTLKEYDYYCSFFTQAPTEYEIDLRPYKETLIAMRICISENGSLEGLAEKLHMKNREFFMVLRVAITGKKITPPLNESMEILGKEEVLSRLTLAAS